MRGAMSLPLWAVALVFATLAPFAAKLLASMFEQRSRGRSRRILAGRRPVGVGGATLVPPKHGQEHAQEAAYKPDGSDV
jgi:hypothetical protein